MRRRLLKIVLALFAAGLALFFAQRSVLYRPPAPRDARAPGSTVVRLKHTLVLHRRAPPGARTVVYFHGNGGHVAGVGAWLVGMLPNVGVAAIDFDIPRSSGRQTQ